MLEMQSGCKGLQCKESDLEIINFKISKMCLLLLTYFVLKRSIGKIAMWIIFCLKIHKYPSYPAILLNFTNTRGEYVKNMSP